MMQKCHLPYSGVAGSLSSGASSYLIPHELGVQVLST
jgi:hypothetical protein